MSEAPSTKTPARPKIYTHRLDGQVVGFTREHRANSAQARFLEGRFTTELATDDEIMQIGQHGLAIGGIDPKAGVDPAQLDWVAAEESANASAGGTE